MESVQKTAPKVAVFCHLSIGISKRYWWLNRMLDYAKALSTYQHEVIAGAVLELSMENELEELNVNTFPPFNIFPLLFPQFCLSKFI
jgi:hypothetical protein